MSNSFLTIFTPTYNRAYYLCALYKSIYEQNEEQIEWLIIDDGSTDNTYEVVKKFIEENKLNIKYIVQKNGGKARAYNNAVRHCKSQFFMCVDSDDVLLPNSLKNILTYCSEIKDNEICAGVGSPSANRDMLNFFPRNSNEFCKLRNVYRNGYKGEMTLVYKTEVLKKFPFPEIEGEKFITENYLYNQIDDFYTTFFVDENWVEYHYLEDGYSSNEKNLYINNPKGWALVFNQRQKYARSLKERIVLCAKYWCFSKLGHNNGIISHSNYPIVTIISIPLGFYYLKNRYCI